MTKLSLLLWSLSMLATPALADLSCTFPTVCLPGEACKDSDFSMMVTGTKAAPMFKNPTFDAYPAHVIPKADYLMLLASEQDSGWEMLSVGPEGEAQLAVASSPDMALPFSYSGTCTGALTE